MAAAAAAAKESAGANVRDAKAQVERTAKEVEEAAAFLAESERRWAVIDVDVPEGSRADDAGSGKKRKVSLSPPAASARERAPVAAMDGLQHRGAAVSPAAQLYPAFAPPSTGANGAGQNGRAAPTRTLTGARPARRARLGLPQHQAVEFETAFRQHRDDTKILLEDSAVRGEGSVSPVKMAEKRRKNLAAMRAASLLAYRRGVRLLTEKELTKKISEAESEGTKLYLEEKLYLEKLSQMAQHSGGSGAKRSKPKT